MAVIALVISFRPYMMNLVPYYMLVEISTIFLHMNWFLIKVKFGCNDGTFAHSFIVYAFRWDWKIQLGIQSIMYFC